MLLLFAPATSAGPVCQGSGCPGSTLPMCVESDAANPADCLGIPQMDCPQVQWLDESVGPVRVTGGGCSVQVYVDGTPVLP